MAMPLMNSQGAVKSEAQEHGHCKGERFRKLDQIDSHPPIVFP